MRGSRAVAHVCWLGGSGGWALMRSGTSKVNILRIMRLSGPRGRRLVAEQQRRLAAAARERRFRPRESRRERRLGAACKLGITTRGERSVRVCVKAIISFSGARTAPEFVARRRTLVRFRPSSLRCSRGRAGGGDPPHPHLPSNPTPTLRESPHNRRSPTRRPPTTRLWSCQTSSPLSHACTRKTSPRKSRHLESPTRDRWLKHVWRLIIAATNNRFSLRSIAAQEVFPRSYLPTL